MFSLSWTVYNWVWFNLFSVFTFCWETLVIFLTSISKSFWILSISFSNLDLYLVTWARFVSSVLSWAASLSFSWANFSSLDWVSTLTCIKDYAFSSFNFFSSCFFSASNFSVSCFDSSFLAYSTKFCAFLASSLVSFSILASYSFFCWASASFSFLIYSLSWVVSVVSFFSRAAIFSLLSFSSSFSFWAISFCCCFKKAIYFSFSSFFCLSMARRLALAAFLASADITLFFWA